MNGYSEECLRTFLKEQGRLFDEPVAETLEEAEAFLKDCMAVVVDSLKEVREYFEESGADVDHMTEEELEEASEVFALPDGTYLIVEGWEKWMRGPEIKLQRQCAEYLTVESRSLFDCGFVYGFFYRIQYHLRSIRSVLRQRDAVQRLGLVNLFGDIFYGRLDEREHGGYRFIQIGKTDRIDVGFVYGYLHFQVCVIQCERGCIDARSVLLIGACILRSAVWPEHDGKEDDEQYPQCGEHGGIDDFFHVQDNDLCLGTHRVTSLSASLSAFMASSCFYKCMTQNGKIFTAFA